MMTMTDELEKLKKKIVDKKKLKKKSKGIQLRACKKCKFISEFEKCPRCGSDSSKNWQGYLLIIDPSKSEIAKKMNISETGRYAIKVK